MRPWRLIRLVISLALGLGGLLPGLGHALAPRVLDSRAAEYALNQRLHDFQAVLQGHRHVSHALAPLVLPSPRLPRAIVGEALAQAETVSGLEDGLAAAERAEDEAQRDATQSPPGSRGAPRAVASQERAVARRHEVDDRMARSLATHQLARHDLTDLLWRRAHHLRTWADVNRKEATRRHAKGDIKGARVWEEQAQDDERHAHRYEDQADRIAHTGHL
jgi:hypothetical protein